jgi:uncharacterized protein
VTVAGAALALFAGAALQSATGFGFALVVSPVAFAVLAPGEALTTLVVLSAALSLLVLASERRDRAVMGHPLSVALLWSLPGLVGGAALLSAVDKPVLQVAVGTAVVVAVLVQVQVGGEPVHAARSAPGWETATTGAVTGLLSTSTGVSGPPMLLWLERQGADPHQVRDTLAAGFLALTVPTALALAAFGEFDTGGVGVGWLALLIVPVAAGRAVGRWLFLRMDAARFRRVGLALAVLAGLASVAAGLLG